MEKLKKSLDDLGARESETDYVIELQGDVLFDFDEWAIRKDAEDTLRKVGEVIRSYNHPVIIIGYTDSIGSEDYNHEPVQKEADPSRTGWSPTPMSNI